MDHFIFKLKEELKTKSSGRFRFLSPDNNQNLGKLEFTQGEVTFCEYIGRVGYNGFLTLCLDFLDFPSKVVF